MKLTLFILSCSLVGMLPAQTITIQNQYNPAISPSAVVGDPVQVKVTGAPANDLVAMYYTYNGGGQQVWYAGYTDNNGNWQTTANAPTNQIGVWTEQWAIGPDINSLTNIGPDWNFEIFDMPTSLTVKSVSASVPDCCGSSYGGYANLIYGPSAATFYQIYGSTGAIESEPSTGLGIMMEPYETGTQYYSGGGSNFLYGAIGCDPNDNGCQSGWLWYPPSSFYANYDGTFYDVPDSWCGTSPYSYYHQSDQDIYIYIGNEKMGYLLDSGDPNM